jgi:hypothetical protein
MAGGSVFQIAGVDDLDAGEPIVIEVFGQRDHSRDRPVATRTHRAGRSSPDFFPTKRPAIWSSLASPALMRRPHAHRARTDIAISTPYRSDSRATDHPSDRDGTQMDNPLRPAWASDVGSTTAFLLQRLAGSHIVVESTLYLSPSLASDQP